MSKISLYIATTIDGYIAKEDGSLDWLHEIPNPDKIDYGYYSFLKEIDIIVIGKSTYNEIISFGVDWPYSEKKTYVITTDRNFKPSTKNTFVLNTIDKNSITILKRESKKNIWLVGGGKVIRHFLNHNAVDNITLTIVPILLGKGIPLFPKEIIETKFELISAEPFNTGLVNLIYKRI